MLYNISMASVINKLLDIAQYINHQINTLFLGTQKMDLWFIGGFLLATILFSLILKKRRVIIFSLAIYVVTALYQALPFDWGIKFGNNIWIFLGGVVVVFILLISTIASGIYGTGGGDYSGRIKLFLLSFITLGFLVSSALNFVTDVNILDQIEVVNRIFSGDLSRGIWAALPLVGFLFLRK